MIAELDLGAWSELCAFARDVFMDTIADYDGYWAPGRAYTFTYTLILGLDFAWDNAAPERLSPMLAALAATDAFNYWRWFNGGFHVDTCFCCYDDGTPMRDLPYHVAHASDTFTDTLAAA